MGFYDNPKIDKAAERSEESVLKTRLLFSLKNNFICREEHPDYGVDLDVEIVISKEASRNKFAIQIKSSAAFPIIKFNEIEYYKLPFLTSRLGYLVRSNPGLGLIVLYNESENLLYYDYAEFIIERIEKLKNTANWTDQEHTTIYIPKINVLNDVSVNAIHERYLQIYSNINLLYNIYSAKFNIPFVKVDLRNDLSTKNELLEIIEGYGTHLINEFKFGELYYALNKLPISEITANAKISFIAAVVYSEIGKPIESNLFIQYCRRNSDKLSDEHYDILEFTEFKNEFLFGLKSYDKYLDTLEKLSLKTKSEANKLTLKINACQLKLYTAISKREIERSLLNELSSILIEIQNSSVDEENKQLLTIYQSTNYHTYALKYVSELLSQRKIQEALNITVSLEDRVEFAKQCITIIEIPSIHVLNALKYAEITENDLIKANALHKLAYFQYGFQFTLALLDYNISSSKDQLSQVLSNSLKYTIEAFRIFNELSLFKDSHLAITLAYEIKQLATLFYGIDLKGIELEKITDIIHNLETTNGLEHFSSIITDFYEFKINKKHSKEIRELNQEEIQYYASSIQKAYNLPDSRLPNIIDDIKNRKYFELNCDLDKYEFIQNNVSGRDIYLYPTEYTIFNKKTGLIIGKSYNIKHLIESTGIKKK